VHADDPKGLFLSRVPEPDLQLLRSLGDLADERGTTAYVVGGVVRDFLLDLPNYDMDVVVEADATDFAEAAAALLGGSVKAHTRFGTVILVLPGGRKVDLATARSEVYERPGALPTVTPGTMESDLQRRDFTVNSMAVVLNPGGFGTLLDPFGGRRDLGDGVLRVLTDRSFEDDPTRILRGVRFSARFGLSIEPVTEALLRQAVDERRTDTVSGERLENELKLILSGDDPWPPVFRLIDWGILSSMVEGWEPTMAVRATIVEIDRLLSGADDVGDPAPERWLTLFAALLQPLPPVVRDRVVERLSTGRRVRRLVGELAEFERDALPALSADDNPLPSELHRMLKRFSSETLLLARAHAPGSPIAERIALYSSRLLGTTAKLTGTDLAQMGVPEGEAVGRILGVLLDARLNGEVSSVEEERALARSLAETLTQGTGTDSVTDESTTDNAVPEAHEMAHEELVEERPVAAAVPDAASVQEPVPDTAPEQEPVPDAPSAQEQKPVLVRRPTYEVHLDTFEGPLDLLLHLIREHEIDIYDIPLATITEQYLEYISFMESLDLALAGEFLEMAATLIRIKVQMLLPKETDAGEEEEDPRQQLVRKLVEYKQFKEVAGTLSSKEEERRGYFPRGVDPRSYADLEEEDEVDMAEFLRDVTLFDLVDGLREVLSRVPERVDIHSVDLEEFTVEAQIDHIRTVISERGSLPFTEVFGTRASRPQVIATFMALLELIRLGEVKAVQTRNFGDIEITARVEE
jgi:chromatin segregation and condensation protein Rec8/ScpA/Scc1 (kleisin family)/tRNA nucleotidyltransferase/poly(A) polymerase